MYNREYTPERIMALKPHEIFVFGSNLAGSHGAGAARLAYDRFGAVWGQGVGLQGQSYAIPTMQGGVETIKPYVDEFIKFAKAHPELKFLVTRIGCGIAGFSPEGIAPLFQEAIDLPNVILPKDFVEVINPDSRVEEHSSHSWNAEKDFLEKYRILTEQVNSGDLDAYYQIKELRTMEFRNTVDIVNQGSYVTEAGKEYTFPDDTHMMRNTAFYEQEIPVSSSAQENDETIVEVQNIDCLYAGVQLKQQGYNPAVLNMASLRNPGGGVTTGAGAQEETLFRRTNLFRSLYQFAPYAGQYGITRSEHQYPLDKNFGGVYTPGAIVFRDSEQKGYALLDEPESLSFITVAGINRPDLTGDGMIADYHAEAIKNKIRTIFRIGMAHGHDSLVLGALGCGAFCNPPHHVARLFHEVMEEPEFRARYRRIVFAILDDHNAHRWHNPEGNFLPFVREFAQKKRKTIMKEFEQKVNNERPIENSYESTKNLYAGEYRPGVERFVEAQNATYEGYKQALEEVRNGKKVKHWIWYVFPQLRGLGRSEMSVYYGIAGREEAEDYLANVTLHDRLHEISEALLLHQDKSAVEIFGPIDKKKVRSCMTLFDAVSPNDVFARVLDRFYGGTRDRRTIKMLSK